MANYTFCLGTGTTRTFTGLSAYNRLAELQEYQYLTPEDFQMMERFYEESGFLKINLKVCIELLDHTLFGSVLEEFFSDNKKLNLEIHPTHQYAGRDRGNSNPLFALVDTLAKDSKLSVSVVYSSYHSEYQMELTTLEISPDNRLRFATHLYCLWDELTTRESKDDDENNFSYLLPVEDANECTCDTGYCDCDDC